MQGGGGSYYPMMPPSPPTAKLTAVGIGGGTFLGGEEDMSAERMEPERVGLPPRAGSFQIQ